MVDCTRKSEATNSQPKTPAKCASRQPVTLAGPCKSDAGSPCIGTKRANNEGSDGLRQSKVPKTEYS